jgi:hypothetical protein
MGGLAHAFAIVCLSLSRLADVSTPDAADARDHDAPATELLRSLLHVCDAVRDGRLQN